MPGDQSARSPAAASAKQMTGSLPVYCRFVDAEPRLNWIEVIGGCAWRQPDLESRLGNLRSGENLQRRRRLVIALVSKRRNFVIGCRRLAVDSGNWPGTNSAAGARMARPLLAAVRE